MSVTSDGAHGATDEAKAAHLGRRSLGVSDIVFFVVAASAPLTVVAGGVPTSFAVTELLGIPLVYVIIAVILLVFAVGYAAMSRHVANSGAFYTYVSKGLGQAWGVSTALVALIAYNAMQVGIFGLYGFAASAALEQFLGVQVSWWICALVTVVCAVVLVLQLRGDPAPPPDPGLDAWAPYWALDSSLSEVGQRSGSLH